MKLATKFLAADFSVKGAKAKRHVESKIKTNMEEEKNIYVQPPVAFMNSIIKQAKNNLNSNIDSADSLAALVEILHADEMIQYSIVYDVVDNGISTVSAIAFHDKTLAPHNMSPSSVWTADVTFGLTEEASGIYKWFFLSRLTASKFSFKYIYLHKDIYV